MYELLCGFSCYREKRFMKISLFEININNAKANIYLQLFSNFLLLLVYKISLPTSQLFLFLHFLSFSRSLFLC